MLQCNAAVGVDMTAECIGYVDYICSRYFVWRDNGTPANIEKYYYGLSKQINHVPYCAYGAIEGMLRSKGIINGAVKSLDKLLSVDRWYDSHIRSWVVQCKDAEGNQVGEAHYVHSNREARQFTVSDFI